MTGTHDIDCLIVGGGPGGLAAATYLARFCRSVVVIDAGGSRLQLIPLSRNIPGFPAGVSGPDFHLRMRAQASAYGAKLIAGRVTACEINGDGFIAHSTAGQFRARSVLLATGVDVSAPDMDDLETAVARGLVRYCPVCDGFEAINARIGVLGGRPGSIEEAHFLMTFSRSVTYVPTVGGPQLTPEQANRARNAGIKLEVRPCVGLSIQGDEIVMRHPAGESAFDTVYPCLGSHPRSELAVSLGARVSSEGELITDVHQATSVAGLYAAGDVLRGLDQVASACGHAAIAATAIHNRLREADERGAMSNAPVDSVRRGDGQGVD